VGHCWWEDNSYDRGAKIKFRELSPPSTSMGPLTEPDRAIIKIIKRI